MQYGLSNSKICLKEGNIEELEGQCLGSFPRRDKAEVSAQGPTGCVDLDRVSRKKGYYVGK